MSAPSFKSYQINYDLDGGINNELNPELYIPSFNEEIELLNPSKEGYEFMGWYLDEDTQITSITKDLMPKDEQTVINIYAKWTPITYYLKYYLDESLLEVYEQVEFNIETEEFGLLIPEIEGKTFIGWFDIDGNEVNSIPLETIGDITLIARFEEAVPEEPIPEGPIPEEPIQEEQTEDIPSEQTSLE